MKAAVFEAEGKLVIKDIDIPKITSPEQVKIEVEAASICGTDVHITSVPPGYAATPNTVLGHEFCGIVVEKGKNVGHLNIGDRVVVNPNNYCGNCVYCRMNLPNECEHIEPLGIDFDGAFAKYCIVNGKTAHCISKDVLPEVAACAEPLACAINGLKKVKILPGSSAVVIGGGPIGLMFFMLLQAAGVKKLYLLETAPYRVKFASELGLGRVINPKVESALEIINSENPIGTDLVFDVTGSQMTTAVELVRKGGNVVLFGVNKNAVSQIPQSGITTKEINVIGTWLANGTFPDAVKVIEQKTIDIQKLITDVIELEQLHDGIAKLSQGEAIKIIVKP